MYGCHGPAGHERWAAARWGRRGFGGRWSGRHGMGGGDLPRLGRVVGSADLQLIALALIAEQPRHGYEIIKVLEEKTDGAYSPSPGMVYPTLTFLEESDYVSAQAEGAKTLYSITDAGRAHLEKNRAHVDALLERLVALGQKVAQMRRRYESEEHDDALPRSIRGAFMDLSEAVREVLTKDKDAKARVIAAIDRAIDDLRKE
ncbi:MAG TPA: PadR family transcriptional regulator [Xanthobacteraceae bacterium]|nr:PadR family transcriptional regulator [Xanthobacteraceae bacterium]